MLTLPPDPTDDHANPAFRDAASCAQWLGQLQLTNLQQAHATLRTQLDEFNRCPVHGLERLQTLELLRETVGHVQGDYAKKLVAKALPLSDDELAVFQSIIGLWQGMITGYRRCLQGYLAGNLQLAPYGVLLCQRCLIYGGLQILESLRTCYEFDGQLWRQMHALYAFAEEQGLHQTEVEDGFSGNSPSCRTIYIKTLLATHAHPEELSRSQLKLLDRWLPQWSSTLSLEQSYAISKGDAPPLAVDLDSALGLQQLAQVKQHGGNLRFLTMVPLSKLLRVKIILLQQGQSPQQLGLGKGINGTDCAEFLSRLHQFWCEERLERMAERYDAVQEIQACYGLEGIYAHVANKPFRLPSKAGNISSAARDQIATFGRTLSDTSRRDLDKLGFTTESWQIEDESMLGARLLRQKAEGTRLAPKQVIATRHSDTAACTLGVIVWLTVTLNGQLRAGVRHLPGTPQAVVVKTTGVSPSASGNAAPALLLPALAKLKIPASLIIPRNLFQTGRMLEITFSSGEKQNVQMGISVEKGLDYERVSFTTAKV
jgi:cyclic-di-GMP-binding protein